MAIEHRTYSELTGPDASGMARQMTGQHERIRRRMAEIRACVAVMSGKGGVGKSLTTAALAAACAARGRSVGLLDADLAGPSAARMSGVAAAGLAVNGTAVEPATAAGTGVRVMSMELLLDDGMPLAWREPDSESFAWRGAQERGALREFIADIEWGRLDLLVVDLPPGTQRLIDLDELLPHLDGVIVLTIPSAASESAVARSMALARARAIPILGVIENMAGYACPKCGEVGSLFPGDAGSRLSREHGVPLLGRIPFDPEAAALAERGALAPLIAETPAGRAIDAIVAALLETIEGPGDDRMRSR